MEFLQARRRAGRDAPPAAAREAGSKTAMDLSVKLVKITGGRFSLGKAGGHARPLVLEDVNIEVRDFFRRQRIPFHV